MRTWSRDHRDDDGARLTSRRREINWCIQSIWRHKNVQSETIHFLLAVFANCPCVWPVISFTVSSSFFIIFLLSYSLSLCVFSLPVFYFVVFALTLWFCGDFYHFNCQLTRSRIYFEKFTMLIRGVYVFVSFQLAFLWIIYCFFFILCSFNLSISLPVCDVHNAFASCQC